MFLLTYEGSSNFCRTLWQIMMKYKWDPYSCGRSLLCSRCRSSYSGRRSTTECTSRRVHSDLASTWEKDRDRQWQSLSRKKDLSRKVSQGETSSLQRSRLHRRAGVWEKTQTESAFKNKREASVFEKKNITSRVPMSSRAQALVVKSKSLL